VFGAFNTYKMKDFNDGFDAIRASGDGDFKNINAS